MADSLMPSSVAKKALSGAFAMGIRQVLGLGINVLANIILARLLLPEDYGIFALLNLTLHFLTVFGDIGLGASLIRQTEEPSDNEYRAIFTVQQLILTFVVLLFWIISPQISVIYDISERNIWLFRLVTISLFFTSFQTIPSIHMERNLDFNRLARIEIVQITVYNLIAVVFAFFGAGALSFALALLGRSLSGAILTNVMSPWRIGWHWDWRIIKSHLNFGLPYQGVSLLSTLNSAINPTLIGLVFGLQSVGYIAWATSLIDQLNRPLFLINRILYPTYSRLRSNTNEMMRAVNITYMATGFVHFGLASLLIGLTPNIIGLIYSDKWLPSLPIVYILIIASIFYPMSISNGALAYSLGWSKTIFYLNIIKTISFWVLAIFLIKLSNNYIAYAYALLITEFLHIALYLIIKKEIPRIDVLVNQLPNLIAGGIIAVFLRLIARQLSINNILELLLLACMGFVFYSILSVVFSYISARTKNDSAFFDSKNIVIKLIREFLPAI